MPDELSLAAIIAGSVLLGLMIVVGMPVVLTFRQNADGVFVAHHYRHSPTTSTFVVECDERTWHQAGLDGMSEEDSRRYCEAVFAPDLAGQPLLTNRSLWLSFKVVTNQRWSVENRVLIDQPTGKRLSPCVCLVLPCTVEPWPPAEVDIGGLPW